MDTTRIHRDPAEDTHPHACWNGYVYLAYTVFEEEIGEEVERIEVIPGRRCEERAGA